MPIVAQDENSDDEDTQHEVPVARQHCDQAPSQAAPPQQAMVCPVLSTLVSS